MSDRNLNELEIESLIKNGCKSDNWQLIKVAEKFDTNRIENVHFSGEINLGVFNDSCQVEKDVLKPTGLYNCTLNNVSIQNNVRVADTGYVQNYIIEEGACVENTKSLIVAGETTFGNGAKLEILNEGGGRQLPIYNELSVQIAYIMVNYRYDNDLINSLEQMVENYVNKIKSKIGRIGRWSEP